MRWRNLVLTRASSVLANHACSTRVRCSSTSTTLLPDYRDSLAVLPNRERPATKALVIPAPQIAQSKLQAPSSTNTDDFDMAQHFKNTSAIYRDLEEVLHLREPSGKPDLKDVVLICVDFEAFEHNQSIITEIGVAALDTADIAHTGQNAPENGDPLAAKSTSEETIAALNDKIKYAHFRPLEFRNLVNRRYLKGCEEGFLFGKTSWISKRDVNRVLTNVFQNPAHITSAADFGKHAIANQNRNTIIVGHGLGNDTRYMKAFGFDPNTTAKIVRRVDTQVLAGATKKAQIGLKRLLSDLGSPGQNWHNAGNDAAFTLQAALRMVVREQEKPGSVIAALQAAKGLPVTELPQSQSTAEHVFMGTSMSVAERDILHDRKHSSFGRKHNMTRIVPGEQSIKKSRKRARKETSSDSGDHAERLKKQRLNSTSKDS